MLQWIPCRVVDTGTNQCLPAHIQEVSDLRIPGAPRHVTTLMRFTALRRISLLVPELGACQVCFTMHAPDTYRRICKHALTGVVC